MSGNGKPLLYGEHVITPELPDEVLRAMNHGEWLVQFAMTLDLKSGPRTPFYDGSISRLKLADRYIRLLERENKGLRDDLKLLSEEGR